MLSFDSIPSELAEVKSEIKEIKRLLSLNTPENIEKEIWLTIDQLCQYLPYKPAKPTIYGKVQKKEIPHYKKGKHLYFLQSEIDIWLKEGRRLTRSEAKSATFIQLKEVHQS